MARVLLSSRQRGVLWEGAPNGEGDTQMMPPDHYYFLMSVLRFGVLGLALVFVVRLIAFLFHYMSWASLA